MIPFSDSPMGRRMFPVVMLSIVAVNVAVFLYQMLFLNGYQLQAFFVTYGLVPYGVVKGVDLGSPEFPFLLTVITAMFIHGGWLHIASNLLFLWVFGDNVESAMGHVRFLMFYILCGIGAAAGQILVDPTSRIPSIGASGAIAGVLAAYLLFYPRARVRTLVLLIPFVTITYVSALFLILLWIVLQVLSGLAELGASHAAGIAYWAHVGGFIAGLVLANVFRRRESAG